MSAARRWASPQSISMGTRCFALTRLPSNSHWRNESSRHGEPRTPLWSSLELGRAASSGDSARVLQRCHECPAWGHFVPTIASNRVCPCLWVKPEFKKGAHLHNFGIPNDWLLQPIFTLLNLWTKYPHPQVSILIFPHCGSNQTGKSKAFGQFC